MTESMSFMPVLAIPQPQLLKTALMYLLLFYEAGKQDAGAARTFTFLTCAQCCFHVFGLLFLRCSTGSKYPRQHPAWQRVSK